MAVLLYDIFLFATTGTFLQAPGVDLGLITLAVLLGPLLEELLIRAPYLWVCTHTTRRWVLFSVLVLQASVFMILHGVISLPHLLLGLATGLLILTSHDLWQSILVHSGWNAAVIMMTVLYLL